MTEQFTPNFPAPQPEKKDTVTFNKKNLAIAFFAAAFVILLIILLVPGDSKDSSPITTAAPVVTNPPVTSPPVNKYDQYMDHVKSNSGQAYSWSDAKIIEFGDLVCGALDNNNSIRKVVNLLDTYSKTSSDTEFFAAVMTGSVMYICPEYLSDMQAYLGN